MKTSRRTKDRRCKTEDESWIWDKWCRREDEARKRCNIKTQIAKAENYKIQRDTLRMDAILGTVWNRNWQIKFNATNQAFLFERVCRPKGDGKVIDGLPFNLEGHNRATSILFTKYGKLSEVASTYIQGIMQLSTINGTNPQKVNEFLWEFDHTCQ